jgi:thiamine-phosphate pyrophosphorylase
MGAMLRRLPRGSALVLRVFGAQDGEGQARAAARICRRRGLKLLIGADIALAHRVRADGVHFPERMGGVRWLRPRAWLVTMAAHSPTALAKARKAGVDAAVLSPIFQSRSASAGAPLGPAPAARWARAAGLPVYALGGINKNTARRLPAASFVGIAAVDAIRT